jgi:hypothetical protein
VQLWEGAPVGDLEVSVQHLEMRLILSHFLVPVYSHENKKSSQVVLRRLIHGTYSSINEATVLWRRISTQMCKCDCVIKNLEI